MPRILIADDDPSVLLLLEMLFIAEGFDVVTACDGFAALELAVLELPDVILLDVMMPEMDGLVLARELRARAETDITPIVFVSARADADDVAAGRAAGGRAYVTKPFDPDELLAVVRAALPQHDAVLPEG